MKDSYKKLAILSYFPSRHGNFSCISAKGQRTVTLATTHIIINNTMCENLYLTQPCNNWLIYYQQQYEQSFSKL
jgi:hypothetical protein